LCEDTQEWRAYLLARNPDELDEGEKAATADVEGLRRFLEGTVLPWLESRQKELVNRPLIREQAFGESLDPDKLERLGRYEVHLDRKLERMLAMLLRLKDLRQGAIAG
jgi:hypothetical protein